MTLKELSGKLRKIADSLDELVGVNLSLSTKNETKVTGKKILKSLKKRKYTKRASKWVK